MAVLCWHFGRIVNIAYHVITGSVRQGYRYHKLRKTFSKFYRRHSGLVEKYNVSLRKRLQKEIPEPDFYGDLVYRIRKEMWGNLILRNNLENVLNLIKE